MLFTILDIETTGFKHGLNTAEYNDDILEVGYIQVDENLKMLRHGVFYFYQDDFVLREDSERVHKLSKEFLEQHKEEFNDSVIKLYTLMQEGIIIGKNNIGFDTPFILDFLKRRGKGLPIINVVNQVDLQDIFTPMFRRWYKENYNESTRHKGKLGELMEVIGKSMEDVESEYKELFPDASDRCGVHSALFDTYMTYLLLEHAVKDGLDLSFYVGAPTAEEQRKYLSSKCANMLQDICDAKAKRVDAVGCDDIDLGDQLGKLFELFANMIQLKDYYVNLGSDALEMQDMLTLVRLGEFGKTLVTRREGITHRYISPIEGELVFRIPYVVGALLVVYYLSEDELVITIAKCLLAFEGYLTNNDLTETPAELPFSCGSAVSPYDMFASYVDYRKNVFKMQTNIDCESPELMQCIQNKNMVKFWQTLIPSSGFLLREYLSGRILNSKGMLQHVLQLLRLKRGGRQ